MKVEELFERVGTNILVVDVQPAYNDWCGRIVPNICQLLNQQVGKKVVMFNDAEISADYLDDVKMYYLDNGLDEEILEDITFIEKQYSFFRGWMDAGYSEGSQFIEDSTIIKTIRAMVMQRKHDSRDLDLKKILTPDEFEEIENTADSIYMPDYVDIAMLRNLSPFYMCGGGRKECLREIELACNAFNIRYKRIDSLVY